MINITAKIEMETLTFVVLRKILCSLPRKNKNAKIHNPITKIITGMSATSQPAEKIGVLRNIGMETDNEITMAAIKNTTPYCLKTSLREDKVRDRKSDIL